MSALAIEPTFFDAAIVAGIFAVVVAVVRSLLGRNDDEDGRGGGGGGGHRQLAPVPVRARYARRR